MREVLVRVPATAANLGPGFDCLGLALGIYMTVVARISDEDLLMVEGEGVIPRDPKKNLVLMAVDLAFQHIGEKRPPLALELRNDIPVARGLGSSAAAVIAGLCLANALAGYPLKEKELLRIAVRMEGHPDNVIPAYLGGFVVSALDGDEPFWIKVPIDEDLRVVLLVPRIQIPTEKAREVLPDLYSKDDCVFNIGRAAMTVASLALGRFDMLGFSMRDRIHQPYRASLMPYLDAAIETALEAGAFGAALSGSGSAVLAFSYPDKAEKIKDGFERFVSRIGMDARAMEVRIDVDGAIVEAG